MTERQRGRREEVLLDCRAGVGIDPDMSPLFRLRGAKESFVECNGVSGQPSGVAIFRPPSRRSLWLEVVRSLNLDGEQAALGPVASALVGRLWQGPERPLFWMDDAILRRREVKLSRGLRKRAGNFDPKQVLRRLHREIPIGRFPERRAKRAGQHRRQRPVEASHPVALAGSERTAVARDDRVTAGNLQHGCHGEPVPPPGPNGVPIAFATRSSFAKDRSDPASGTRSRTNAFMVAMALTPPGCLPPSMEIV